MTYDDWKCTDPADLEPDWSYEGRGEGAAPPWMDGDELEAARVSERRWDEREAGRAVVAFLRAAASEPCEDCGGRDGEHAPLCGMCRDCGGEDGHHEPWCCCDERRVVR